MTEEAPESPASDSGSDLAALLDRELDALQSLPGSPRNVDDLVVQAER